MMKQLASLSLLADRCLSMRQLNQVHTQMIISGRISDNFAASRLLNFAGIHPSGDLSVAVSLFNSFPSPPNSFMYNTLIRALAASPNPSAALQLYAHMRSARDSPPPGKHTFPFVLKACANLKSLDSAVQIHSQVVKFGLGTDLYVMNGLVRCYGCCGQLRHARKLFDEMPDRNSIVWTTMISAYAQNFCSSDAILLFDEMVRSKIEPCDATLASVLSACARTGGLDVGYRIHRFIESKGLEIGVILGTALVDMYAKNGIITLARHLFDEMAEKNTATWNAVICGMAHHGHANDALDLFRQLEREKIVPNDVTFVGVLSACCHAGMVEVGRDIFRSMENEYSIEPKVEHYGCMVDLLGRSGRLEEAEDLIKGMKWEADVVVLGALLTACKHHGNVEIAERVVLRILKLEPHNHGVYVILSNMYAEAGRWEDVTRLRKAMGDGGLSKNPAWSCV